MLFSRNGLHDEWGNSKLHNVNTGLIMDGPWGCWAWSQSFLPSCDPPFSSTLYLEAVYVNSNLNLAL
jgi:hypothetical protein